MSHVDPTATVFLVDDDDSVRRALKRLIRLEGYVVQDFGSARELLGHGYEVSGPACLVLDVSMPEVTGQELHRELQRSGAILPVIFITAHGDIPMGVEAMKSGAVDFLPKPVKGDDLLRAIEDALYRAAQERQEKAEQDMIRNRVDSLTDREREVMRLVVTGMLNKQIAAELGIVEKTVKVHRARIMQKMRVQSLAELVQIVLKG